MVLILILILLIGICYIKYIGNKELIKNNCKTEEDQNNAKNARKVYSTTKTSYVILALSGLSLIIVLLLNFTNIDYAIRDFISTEIVEKREFSYYSYLIPIYILVCRQIIIEVNLGEFLYKFFNVEEPEMDNTFIKNILSKKNKSQEKLSFEEMLRQKEQEMQSMPEILDPEPEAPNIIKDEPKAKVKDVKEEINPEEKPLGREQETLDLPEIKKDE